MGGIVTVSISQGEKKSSYEQELRNTRLSASQLLNFE